MRDSVCIIIQKLSGGGAERTASNLSEILEKKYNVHLIVFDNSSPKYPASGVVHDLKTFPAKTLAGKMVNFLLRVIAVKKIKKKHRVIASISLMDGANLVNVLTASGDKILTSVRIKMSESRFGNPLKKLWNILRMRFIARHSNKVVALSEGVRYDLIKCFGLGSEKVKVIYNPVDRDKLIKLANTNAHDSVDVGSNAVSTMGRLTNQKGQWHLVRCFQKVVQEIPAAQLFIFGEGELNDLLHSIVDELLLTKNVHFKGYVQAPHSYIAQTKVFVLSSLFEGLGNVLLEAMACGIPCIATDCQSGPREILAPGTDINRQTERAEYAQFGILTPVCGREQKNAVEMLTKEEEILADAIITILKNEDMRLEYAKKGIERVQGFSSEEIFNNWKALIEGN